MIAQATAAFILLSAVLAADVFPGSSDDVRALVTVRPGLVLIAARTRTSINQKSCSARSEDGGHPCERRSLTETTAA
jgi:hypothetical protein